ncbi:MAG: hypothetical protein KKB35_05535, partial [Proteobacteria bacterium]|nr:hypothetical protein [Pseudomonadota bacterium]
HWKSASRVSGEFTSQVGTGALVLTGDNQKPKPCGIVSPDNMAVTPIERKSSIGRIQNSVDPRGIDSIFHGAPIAGSTLPSDRQKTEWPEIRCQ